MIIATSDAHPIETNTLFIYPIHAFLGGMHRVIISRSNHANQIIT
jgi:hypothetical protein